MNEVKKFEGGVPEWKIKELGNAEQVIIRNGEADMFIVNETEKALKIECESDYGKFSFWLPKSAVSAPAVYEEVNADFTNKAGGIVHIVKKSGDMGYTADGRTFYLPVLTKI